MSDTNSNHEFTLDLAEDYGKASAALVSAVEAGEALRERLKELTGGDDRVLRIYGPSVARQRAIYEALRRKRKDSLERATRRFSDLTGVSI
jgi:hypothetical protein